MPPFAARPLSSPKSHPIFAQIRRHPFILFGLPFVGIIIGSSFALQAFTQTRYDYQETKVKSVGKEEELGMKSGRRKIDLKEEYYVRFFFHFFFFVKGASLIGSIETKQPDRRQFLPRQLSRNAQLPLLSFISGCFASFFTGATKEEEKVLHGLYFAK